VGRLALLCVLVSISGRADDSVDFHGQYRNLAGYAYGATVPPGFTGHRMPAPAPDHGFAIDLSPEAGARIWVDGSYDVLFARSAREAVEQSISWIRERGGLIGAPQLLGSQLGGLQAAETTVQYRDSKTGVVRACRAIAAIRHWSGEPGGIIYTVTLDTTAYRLSSDGTVWRSVLKSFRLLKQ
jgi:hypothetical protein